MVVVDVDTWLLDGSSSSTRASSELQLSVLQHKTNLPALFSSTVPKQVR